MALFQTAIGNTFPDGLINQPRMISGVSYQHVARQQLQSKKNNPTNSNMSVAMMKWQTRSHYETNGENKASKDHDKSWIRRIQTRRTAHYHNVNEASKR